MSRVLETVSVRTGLASPGIRLVLGGKVGGMKWKEKDNAMTFRLITPRLISFLIDFHALLIVDLKPPSA